MAVRAPLKYDGSNIRPMSTAEVDALITRAIYAYSQSPAVTLSYVASGGSLGSIDDTRLQAGTSTTRVDRFATRVETPDVTTVTVSYSRIDETVTNASQPGNTAPLCYVTPSGDIRAMTVQDIYDTIVHPAIDRMVSGTLSDDTAGTYFIATSTSVADASVVSTNPIFTDTRADTSLYTSGSIPETLDQPTINQSYWLHVRNGSSSVPTRPLYVLANGDLKEYPIADFDTYFQQAINYSASQEVGYRIRYSFSSGTNRGTVMTDTILDSSDYATRFVNADDYRTQEFPGGSPTTVSTYYLKISKS